MVCLLGSHYLGLLVAMKRKTEQTLECVIFFAIFHAQYLSFFLGSKKD